MDAETDEFSYNVAEQPLHVYDLNATILHCVTSITSDRLIDIRAETTVRPISTARSSVFF